MEGENESQVVEQASLDDILSQAGDGATESQPNEDAAPAPAEPPSHEELLAELKGWQGRSAAEVRRRRGLQEQLRELKEQNEALLAAAEADAIDPAEAQQWLDPVGTEQRIKLTGRVSRSEYISDNGRETFQALESAVERAFQAGHPDLAALSQEMRASDDPVGVMDRWARTALGWNPDVRAAPQARQTFPSNLAGARNVGRRSGPEWGGPPSLNDIFNRARAKG